ncbi:MAG TPA: DUF2255 family protein [Galbitalea sp.]
MTDDNTQSDWPTAQLAEIERSEELVLVIARDGHDTLRVPVWPVTVDEDVYVRSYKGVTSVWFRRVAREKRQAIVLAGGDMPVMFEDVDRDDHVNRAISAAYDRKYERFDYRSAMSEPAAIEATLRILPG